MIWHFIRYIVTFVMPIFYKRVQGKNTQNLMVKKPVIIAMNHPNAFTDPILLTYITGTLRLNYLARGDAFKPGLAATLLEAIGIVPIFRIQDGGKEGLKKNDEAYRRVNALLKRNAKIIVFAEGLCIQERRLRPLKKGVARMVFGAYENINNEELTVIPIGVNYSKPDKMRSDLLYNIGEPIPVKDFIEEYKQHPARAQKHFLEVLEPKMKELITHINNKEYDELVPQLEILLMKHELKKQGLKYGNLEHHLIVTRQITEKVNTADLNNKALLDELKQKTAAYFKDVRKARLRDWLINRETNKLVTPAFAVLRVIGLILGFPVYALGCIANYPAAKLTEKLVKKILKGNQEFYSSVCIGVGMIFLYITYLIWFIVVYILSPSILWPLLTIFAMAITGWFALYFHFFMAKTVGVIRALKNQKTVKALAQRREEVLSLINKL